MVSNVGCPQCLAWAPSLDEPCSRCGASITSATAVRFGGFWVRFAAFWLDFVVLLPVVVPIVCINRHYRLFPVYSFIPLNLLYLFFWVYLVRRYGGTPGKLLMGLRIVRLDGTPAGYREALLRYAPEAILSWLLSVSLVMALSRMTDAQFSAADWRHRRQLEHSLAPAWREPVDIANQVWTWSEFAVLLMNRRRRALHDFLAGTLVIRQRRG